MEDIIMVRQCESFDKLQHFSRSEARAITVHKYHLSEQAGYDVGIDFAIEDWLRHHAERWRSHRLRHDLHEQAEEIRRHKWIESERAGRDLGQEAVVDWIDRYAETWREWREEQD